MTAAVQTEEWSGSERAAAVGEELMAERRSRASERAALEAKIQVCVCVCVCVLSLKGQNLGVPLVSGGDTE